MASFASILLVLLSLFAALALAVRVTNATVLGLDPQTVNHLNGESYQQDALITYQSASHFMRFWCCWQYATFWVVDTTNASIRHATLARRQLLSRASLDWEMVTFTDYNQTEDDGHDTISIGISAGDGTIHMSFDHHDNRLKYRVSEYGIASHPAEITWNSSLFGEILDHLPGTEHLNATEVFGSVTYPRFLSTPSILSPAADLIFELRIGRSGLGDDWLYEYTPWKGWSLIGKYLLGVNNNAYINGLDFDNEGNMATTWTYRDFVNDSGQDVAVQTGPNGPENNHDLDFALSPNFGRTWLNTWGQPIANIPDGIPISPNSAGITIFSIPKYGGILNQESQVIDAQGRIHVLNRENTTGTEQWYHYWRSTRSYWTRTAFPLNLPSVNNITGTPTAIGKRGKLAAVGSTLFAILPSNAPNSTALSILASTAEGHFRDWEVFWEVASGCGWEPLFDRYRLNHGDGVLSLFMINGTDVVVMDLDLELS
ncbi:hypothetical protein K488DRAFT_80693 [Vararia minispora EC-137]|uniref:Uncharacterized protein n=1 Tax=Vararia minispora EC-137 TaxID=1314806 RepID=A0ACB8Q9K1_9AGAM|nr:hypothetical protein K488DRAFT_80693 [Vararia minispora EC-137]